MKNKQFKKLLIVLFVFIFVDPVSAASFNDQFKAPEGAAQRIETQLAKRYPELSKDRRQGYRSALLAMPDFKSISLTNEKATKLKATLLPVLKLFKRENYTEIAVVENDTPFVGIYREFIIIFSSSILKNLTDQELRAAAAHELAHEVFMKEFEGFVKLKDFHGQQEIESKCDLFAAQISLILNDDPMSIIKAVKKVRKLSGKKEQAINDTHASPDDREKSLKLALKN